MRGGSWMGAGAIALTLACGAAQAAGANGLVVTVKPAAVLIEAREVQELNFDFEVLNATPRPIELTRVELAVHDRRGAISLNRDVDRSGASPAIFTVAPDREIAAGAKGLVFNPFTTFPIGLDLA